MRSSVDKDEVETFAHGPCIGSEGGWKRRVEKEEGRKKRGGCRRSDNNETIRGIRGGYQSPFKGLTVISAPASRPIRCT